MKRLVVFVGAMALAGAAWGAQSPGQKCETGKNMEAGKYASCLHKAEAKLLKTKGTCALLPTASCYGDAECGPVGPCVKDLTKYGEAVAKCEGKFEAKWDKLTQTAVDKGDLCPDGLQQTDVKAVIDDCVENVAGGLAGDGLDLCGNGAIDAGEECDFGVIGSGTCASKGFAGGTIACNADCTYDTSECFTSRYVDNGDGTISDNETGLMWAKKSDDGSIHDMDNRYTWGVLTISPYPPIGTAFAVYLALLNGSAGGACFAGHCDWRLPTIEELQGLVVWSAASTTIDPIFKSPCTPGCTVTECSCTQSSFYWSASTEQSFPTVAWYVFFGSGHNSVFDKTGDYHVRAVRSGS